MNLPRRQPRWTAWLALAALALAVTAPVVSRLLMPPMTWSSAMADCGEHGAAAHDNLHGSPLDACGYCSLFCHLPLATGVAPTLQLAAALPPLPPSGPAPFAQAAHPILAARPRGPPQAQA